MRHIPDGVLRRLDDEPLAVADRVSDHLATCGRCSARRDQIAHDTECVAPAFLRTATRTRHRRRLGAASARVAPDRQDGAVRRRRRAPALRRRARLPRVPLRTALAIGAVGIVVAGTAAAATLTTIFAPTHVAPVALSQSDLRAIAAVTGLGNSQPLGGFATPTGSSTLRFGTITWSSGGSHPASSLAQATAEAGFPVSLPAHLPAGVGAVQRLIVQPRGRATISFNSKAGTLAGSSVRLDAGPAVFADMAAANGPGAPTLGVATMRRPTAQSTGASLSQIEAFLLGQPGIPPQLAEEVRLLGDLRTILPVPVPARRLGALGTGRRLAGRAAGRLLERGRRGGLGGRPWPASCCRRNPRSPRCPECREPTRLR